MCQEISKSNGQEKRIIYKKLEKAAQNFMKETYGLQCKVEGVIEERKYNSGDVTELLKLINALSEIKLDYIDGSMELFVPAFFMFDSISKSVKIFDNSEDALILLNRIMSKIVNIEISILPGNNTSTSLNNFSSKFLVALTEFKDCFLEYVEYVDC